MHSYRFVPCIAVVACASVLACAPQERDARFTAGDTVTSTVAPQRIVSLNPAATELVFALGAGARLVGRTHWDTYPDSARAVPDLGDGMRPNIERILNARPDLVLLYASAENLAARDALRRSGIATLTQRSDRVGDFARGVMQLGQALHATDRATIVRDSVLASLQRAHARVAGLRTPKVFWPLWDSPIMSVGRGSFLNDLLNVAGAVNIFGDLEAPSPQVTYEEIVRRDPDFILVSPDRIAKMRANPKWTALRAVREGRLIVYDTLLVGRPGVRLGEAAAHLATLLHPDTGRTP